MKKSLLILIPTIVLCFSLTSCSLKDAIIGNKSNNAESKTTISNAEVKGNITNNESTKKDASTKSNKKEESTESNKKDTNDNKTIDNIISDNNNLLKTDNSKSTSASVDNSSISTNSKTITRDCRVFYFNKVDLKTYCTDTSVAVKDNALVTALTEKLYEAPNNNNNFLVLSKDYGVKSATLDYETNILKVVFNKNFVDAMKLDTATANGLMLGIVDTYGYNYGVEKVAIYFGDQLYTGLEGTSSAGYSKINYSSTLKLN